MVLSLDSTCQLPSTTCPKTFWPTTNSTLIGGLSFCARGGGSMVPLASCTNNGRLLTLVDGYKISASKGVDGVRPQEVYHCWARA